MGKIVEQQDIVDLVQKLTINDVKDAGEYEEEPEEPRQAMDDLVKIGEPATKELIKLLKSTLKYSSLYAVTVLSKMQSVDPIAIKPLFSLLGDEEFVNFSDGEENAVRALQKIGLPALQPVLRYLEEQKKRDDVSGIIWALMTLSGIKDEKSYAALIDGLSYKNDEVQGSALDYLSEYGDKRALEPLSKLLEDPEWADHKDLVQWHIRDLAEPDEYRKILLQHGLIKPNRMDSFTKETARFTREMTYGLGKFGLGEFGGTDADIFNEIKRKLPVMEALEGLFYELAELAVEEAVISKKQFRQLENISDELREQRFSLEEDYREELGILEWNYYYVFEGEYRKGEKERTDFYRENFVTNEKRCYKSLTPQGQREPSDFSVFTKTLQEWLQQQDFLITTHRGSVIARRGNKAMRQGCFVDVWSAPVSWDNRESMHHLRLYKIVELTLWGKGWTDDSKSSFLKSFWEFVDDTIFKMVGKKKYNREILQDCTVCGETWLPSELDHGLCIYHRKAKNS